MTPLIKSDKILHLRKYPQKPENLRVLEVMAFYNFSMRPFITKKFIIIVIGVTSILAIIAENPVTKASEIFDTINESISPRSLETKKIKIT